MCLIECNLIIIGYYRKRAKSNTDLYRISKKRLYMVMTSDDSTLLPLSSKAWALMGIEIVIKGLPERKCYSITCILPCYAQMLYLLLHHTAISIFVSYLD